MQTKLVLKQPTAIKLRFQPGATGPSGTIEVGTTTTGTPGTDAAVTNSGTPSAAILNFTIPRGDTGLTGDNGWTPELATVTDGMREVQQVVDWFGGEGTKPTTGLYVGDTGLVVDIANGKDIRGPQGPSGSVTDGDKGDITVSSSGTNWVIDAKAVSLAKQADVATGVIMGRATAGTGSQEALSPSSARTVLGLGSMAVEDASDFVAKTGDETIAGVKTFSNPIVGNLTGNADTVFNFNQDDFDYRYVGDVRWGAVAVITVDTGTAPGYNRWKAPPGCALVDIFQSVGSQLIDFPTARSIQKYSHFSGTWVTVSEV